ncbi:hypothetical protein M3914_003102 [Vibrio metschnikovii]|nr:hypothetical protein [Vibrio metschnikovii]
MKDATCLQTALEDHCISLVYDLNNGSKLMTKPLFLCEESNDVDTDAFLGFAQRLRKSEPLLNKVSKPLRDFDQSKSFSIKDLLLKNYPAIESELKSKWKEKLSNTDERLHPDANLFMVMAGCFRGPNYDSFIENEIYSYLFEPDFVDSWDWMTNEAINIIYRVFCNECLTFGGYVPCHFNNKELILINPNEIKLGEKINFITTSYTNSDIAFDFMHQLASCYIAEDKQVILRWTHKVNIKRFGVSSVFRDMEEAVHFCLTQIPDYRDYVTYVDKYRAMVTSTYTNLIKHVDTYNKAIKL